MSLTDRQIEGRFEGLERRVLELEHQLEGTTVRIAVLVEKENERTAAKESKPALQGVREGGPVFPTPVQKARTNRPVSQPGTEASDA